MLTVTELFIHTHLSTLEFDLIQPPVEYIKHVRPKDVRTVKTRYVYLGKGTPIKFTLPPR